MIESGYMQIRWYQQSSQGTKCAISERKRLPPVAIAATRNATRARSPRARRGRRRAAAGTPTSARTRARDPGEDDLARDPENRQQDDDVVGHNSQRRCVGFKRT